MYLEFFNLKERPFNLTPDTDFIFPSTQYSQAINYLLYGIEQKKGFILITGEVGAGKTTLCRSLLRKLDSQKVEIAIVLNSFLSAFELLKSINKDFSLSGSGVTNEELIEELNEFLLKQKELNRNVVLMIDECQNLSLPVLEQIRMLSNLETEKEKLLQIILIGQPELQNILNSTELRQLNQRITVRYHIQPLRIGETEQYLYHRIKVASEGDTKIYFTKKAIKKIFKFSKGVPRLINVLADYVLLNAFIHDTHKVTEAIVKGAISEVEGKAHHSKRNKNVIKKAVLVGVVGLLLSFSFLFRQEIFSSIVHLNKNINQSLTPVPDVESDLNVSTQPQFYISRETYKSDVSLIEAESQAKEDVKEGLEFVQVKENPQLVFKLLKRWHISEEKINRQLQQAKGTRFSWEAIAERFDFKTLKMWTNLETIKRLQIQALIKFENDRFGIIEKIEDDKIVVILSNKKVEYSNEDFKSLWQGETLYLYEKSANLEKILYLGLKGEAVLDLQEKLWKLNFYNGNFTGIFDELTEIGVKNFQTSYGMISDGVVGVEMQILFYRIFREDKVPKLKDN
ncbi:AAA family ATPase [Candidatus Auribacterota bacterium]